MERELGGPRGGAAHLAIDADEGGERAAVVAPQPGRELSDGQPPEESLKLSRYVPRVQAKLEGINMIG
jgi:hypothetical protein